jgi:hypothetical protein
MEKLKKKKKKRLKSSFTGHNSIIVERHWGRVRVEEYKRIIVMVLFIPILDDAAVGV